MPGHLPLLALKGCGGCRPHPGGLHGRPSALPGRHSEILSHSGGGKQGQDTAVFQRDVLLEGGAQGPDLFLQA